MTNSQFPSSTTESPLVRRTLITAALLFLSVFLLFPLIIIFTNALAEGWSAYVHEIANEPTWNAIKLTLLTAVIAVPLNTIFGVAAAWAVTKFAFRRKSLLPPAIHLPFSTSPVVARLTLVLLFGLGGYLSGLTNR